MVNLGAKYNEDNYSDAYLKGETSSTKHWKQVKCKNRHSFSRMCEAIVQFSSRLIDATEQSTTKEDEKESLNSYAILVTENDRLWDEFIKEMRESKIITNEGVLLAFEHFRRKKTALGYDPLCAQQNMMDNSKVDNIFKSINLTDENERKNMRRPKSDVRDRSSDNLITELFNKSS